MRELENLKELYLDEIKKINKKGELTPTDAEAASKALEAIEKINDICQISEYSNRAYRINRSNRSYMPEMSPYEYGYMDRRGSNGRYMSRSSDDTVNHMIHKLEELRSEAPDMSVQMAIDKVLDKLETY